MRAEQTPGYQGVVELDERVIGFELPGRLSQLLVDRGAFVQNGQRVAVLDSELEATMRSARASDAAAAHAELALVKAGSRGEEIRSMEAQVRAARATEALLSKSLEREKALRARNASTDAAVDDLSGQLDRAIAERQSLDQRQNQLRRGSRVEERSAAEARADAADAAVKLEDERLARYVLYSPLDGVVLDVHAKSGEVVAAGTPVVTIADAKHPYVDVFVAEGDLSGLKMGVRAEVRVDGEAVPLGGFIETVSPKTEFTPRFLFSERERPNLVVRSRVRVEDPAERLHAGVPAFVTFQREKPVHP